MELDPFWAAASRFATASVIFLLVMLFQRTSFGSWRTIKAASLYGLVNIGMAFAFVYWGFLRTPAGTGQVLVAVTPLATLVLAHLHGLERVQLRPVVGALIGLVGVGVVLADQLEAAVPLPSLLAVLAGSLCLAEGVVIVKLAPNAHPVTTNAIGMAVGAAFLACISLITGESWEAPTNAQTWVAVAFLILGGSVVFSWLTVFIVRRWTASAASYLFLLLPPVAIVYGAAFAGESIGVGLLVGGALISVGVWFSGILEEGEAT
jgi:drug/metabolite transporter (DMT)-like permease